MPETTPLIKAALNLRVGAGFDVYDIFSKSVEHQGGANRTFKASGRCHGWQLEPCPYGLEPLLTFRQKIPTGRLYIEEGCSVRRGHLGFFVNPVKNHLHILQAVHEGGSIYKSS